MTTTATEPTPTTDPAPLTQPRAPRTTALRVSALPGAPGPGRRPDATRPSRVRRVRLGEARATTADDEPEPRPVAPQPAAPLPDPTAQCCSVVRAAVEVLRGERGPLQLARWVTPRVLDQLTERARLTQAHGSPDAPTRPVLVRRVRLLRLGQDVAEATVILDDGGRVRAAAARLEARRGVWRVTVLELG